MHHNIYANLRLIPGNSRLKIYLPPLFMAIILHTSTEQLITSKILSSDLDKLKKTAVECMKDYIEHSQFSTEKKEELKNNYEHWADVTLEGIKQRLRDSDKLHE